MDEKKPGQTQNLDDAQLEGVSGGVRVSAARSRVTVVDADDGARLTSVFSADDGSAVRCVANDDDEELDGWIPHIPITHPTARSVF